MFKITKLITILTLAVFISINTATFANTENTVTYTSMLDMRFIYEKEMAYKSTLDPITVVETDFNIHIYAYVFITGGAADKFIHSVRGITYRQAAAEGIKRRWSGRYEGKNVYALVVDLNDGKPHIVKTGQNSLVIEINLGIGACHLTGVGNGERWSRSNPGRIVMYQQDEQMDVAFPYTNFFALGFGEAVAHEFGHALGLHHSKPGTESIMRNPGRIASDADYKYMLIAQRTNTWQDENAWPE